MSVPAAILARDSTQDGGSAPKILGRSFTTKPAMLASRHPSLVALCDQGAISVTNFATGVIVGRTCGRAELGVYTLAWTLITVAIEVPALFTITPYTVFGPHMDGSRRKQYLGSILIHQLLLSILFALLAAAGAGVGSWRGWLSNSISNVVTTAAGVIVFVNLREFIRRISFAELNGYLAISVDVVACFLQLTGLLLLFRFCAVTPARVYTLLGASSAVAAGGWFICFWGNFHLERPLWLREFRQNWSFAKWLLASWILAGLATYIYPWLLALVHGTSAAGVWAACWAIIGFGNPVLLGLANHIAPTIANVYAASGAVGMRRYIRRSSLTLAAILSPLVIVLAVCGEHIVSGVYGQAYAGNGRVVLFLALNMLITAMTYPYSRGLFSIECAKTDMLINLAAAIILFTFGIFAIQSYEVTGAAVTLCIGSGFTAIIRSIVFNHKIHQRARIRSHAPAFLGVTSQTD
jgi:O-antigen/teichoic acid export membrane protein